MFLHGGIQRSADTAIKHSQKAQSNMKQATDKTWTEQKTYLCKPISCSHSEENAPNANKTHICMYTHQNETVWQCISWMLHQMASPCSNKTTNNKTTITALTDVTQIWWESQVFHGTLAEQKRDLFCQSNMCDTPMDDEQQCLLNSMKPGQPKKLTIRHIKGDTKRRCK